MSALRCRKGDMAMILRGSVCGNDGKIVEVLEFLGDGFRLNGVEFGNVWHVSIAGESRNPATGLRWGCPDAYLLPIRPGDLDETEETSKELERQS